MLLGLIRNGRADLVVGSRYAGASCASLSLRRRFLVRLLAFAHTAISRQKLTDPTSALRAYGSRALRFCLSPDYPTNFEHTNMTTVLAMAGFRIEEVAVQGTQPEGMTVRVRELASYLRQAITASILTLLRRGWLRAWGAARMGG